MGCHYEGPGAVGYGIMEVFQKTKGPIKVQACLEIFSKSWVRRIDPKAAKLSVLQLELTVLHHWQPEIRVIFRFYRV